MENSEMSTPVYSNPSLSYQQDVIYRQENFPCGRTYKIFPPASSKYGEPQSHKLNINSIENRDDLLVSNLPLDERACLQKYNIKCTPKYFNLMTDAVKYIFHAYSFEFEANGNEFLKTHYFSVAPNINIETMATSLPSIYRTSVCVEMDNPKHYSFSTYAIMGGCADGFFFMNRLDNNYEEFAHICKGCKRGHKPQVVQFPHLHQPSLQGKGHCRSEFSPPYHLPFLKGKDQHSCLSYFLKLNNISSKMLLVQEDMPVNVVTEYAKLFDETRSLENTELGALGKIALTNVGRYAVSVEESDFHPDLPTQECGAPYLHK